MLLGLVYINCKNFINKLFFSSDPANYEQVKFFCRPWHNVSGEVNYRTAKLLLTGVFVHVSSNVLVFLQEVSFVVTKVI